MLMKTIIDSYFPKIMTTPFQSTEEEHQQFLRFLDLLCLISVQQAAVSIRSERNVRSLAKKIFVRCIRPCCSGLIVPWSRGISLRRFPDYFVMGYHSLWSNWLFYWPLRQRLRKSIFKYMQTSLVRMRTWLTLQSDYA